MTHSGRSMAIIVPAALAFALSLFFAPAIFASNQDGAELVYDDGPFKAFVSHGEDQALEQAVIDPLAKPKVKVLAAYSGTSANPYEIFPWFTRGETIYLKACFEIRRAEDTVKTVFIVTGANDYKMKFPGPTLGPVKPGERWDVWFAAPTEPDSDPGLYKVKAIVKPVTNKKRGADREACRARLNP